MSEKVWQEKKETTVKYNGFHALAILEPATIMHSQLGYNSTENQDMLHIALLW